MKIKVDLLIIGHGNLAQSIALSLSTMKMSRSYNIMLMASHAVELKQLCEVLNIRARSSNSTNKFHYAVINWQLERSIFEILVNTNPKLIIVCSSLQSPWVNNTCQWQQLVQQLGFGITLPLQMLRVLQIVKLIKLLKHDSILLNACYPDVVNAVINTMGYPIFSGIGNINILYASFPQEMRTQQLLAHHLHLSKFGHANYKAPLIIANNKLNNLPMQYLKPLRVINGAVINHITGLISAQLIQTILENKQIHTHLPGPCGLLGGYPVMIKNKVIKIAIKNHKLLRQAITANERWTQAEGIILHNNGRVNFTKPIAKVLKQKNFTFYNGFHPNELNRICNEIIKFRGC